MLTSESKVSGSCHKKVSGVSGFAFMVKPTCILPVTVAIKVWFWFPVIKMLGSKLSEIGEPCK